MNGFINILSLVFQQTGNIEFLINLILKGSLILLLAMGANLLLRFSSAAVRHWVWCLAFGGLLLLVPFSLLLPKKPISLLPQVQSVSYSDNSPASPVNNSGKRTLEKTESFLSTRESSGQIMRRENSIHSLTEVRKENPEIAGSASVSEQKSQPLRPSMAKGITINWSSLIFVIWVSGVFVFFLRFAWSLTKIWKISSEGQEIADKGLKKLLKACEENYGVRGSIHMVSTRNIGIPATFGLFRAVLLLPADISTWPKDKQKAAICHELAHIKRRDYIFNLIAQMACALYWFNPLVWMAIRSFWIERENACDDFVLQNGTRDYEYADHLLEIACRFSRLKSLRRCASVMASKSDLKNRLTHILSKKASRRALTLRAFVLSVLGVLFILLPLATASIQEKQSKVESVTLLYGKNLNELISDLQNRNPEVRLQAAWALGDRENDSAVPALIKALKDKDPEVRGMVAWALGEIKDKRAMVPLSESLDDENSYALEMMVKALGEFEDETAVEPLAQVFKEENPDVRTAVVWAMGEIEGQEAFEIVVKALKDSSGQVREMAVSVLADFETRAALEELKFMLNDKEAGVRAEAAKSLGILESREAVSALVQALNDREAKVRLMAAWALGEIGDPRAVNPLFKLLRDKDPEVRAMVVWSLDEVSLDK